MSAAFTNYSLLGNDSFAGVESLAILPSTTVTMKAFGITMWDSNRGLFLTLAGTRYGALPTNVSVTLQQATLPDAPDSAWEDVGATIDVGTGGTFAVPATVYTTVSVFPPANECLMPFLRLKFVAAAASGATLNKVFRTTKGR